LTDDAIDILSEYDRTISTPNRHIPRYEKTLKDGNPQGSRRIPNEIPPILH